MLEDIEGHINDISCSQEGIRLRFNRVDVFAHAHKEFKSVENFLLVTSHEGCNEAGERDPHL